MFPEEVGSNSTSQKLFCCWCVYHLKGSLHLHWHRLFCQRDGDLSRLLQWDQITCKDVTCISPSEFVVQSLSSWIHWRNLQSKKTSRSSYKSELGWWVAVQFFHDQPLKQSLWQNTSKAIPNLHSLPLTGFILLEHCTSSFWRLKLREATKVGDSSTQSRGPPGSLPKCHQRAPTATTQATCSVPWAAGEKWILMRNSLYKHSTFDP